VPITTGRTLEILDRRALAQELWGEHDSEIGVRTKLADDALGTSSPVPTGTVDLLTTP